MKKYRLKKWYPSLPKCLKDGTEVVRFLGDNDYVSCDESCPVSIHACQVENNPEFWEELRDAQKQDYEILTYKRDGGYIVRKDNKGWIMSDCIRLAESELTKSKYSIHSVRRLSDGEVFTVGDRVAKSKSWEVGTPCVINSFYIKSDKFYVELKQGKFTWSYTFKNFYKFQDPLFTTEDGVDIYEGDYAWVPQKSRLDDEYVINGDIVRFKLCKPQHYYIKEQEGGVKYFSTKEKAQEYIDYNKPQYSLQQISDAYLKLPSVNGYSYHEFLEHLLDE